MNPSDDLPKLRLATPESAKELARQFAREKRIVSQQKQDAKWRSTFKSQMNALMRAQFLGSELTGTDALQAKRFRVRSQNEEDGIVLALLQAAGTPTRRFVEIGSGGNGGNSGLLAYEFGWEGLLLDASGAAVRAAREVFAGKPRVHPLEIGMRHEAAPDARLVRHDDQPRARASEIGQGSPQA